MNPLDPKSMVCGQHVQLVNNVAALLGLNQKQSENLEKITSKLEAVHSDVVVHKTEHATEEKVKARSKWIYPLLLTLVLAILGAAFWVGQRMPGAQAQLDVKAIAAAVAADLKAHP